jgi:tRNA modification GTPase
MTGYSFGDTIAAIATAPARGALGIVRLSGPDAWRIARSLAPALPQRLRTRHAYVRSAVLPSSDGGAVESMCVVLPWRAPRTYTGEDMVELSLHGSPALLELALTACLGAGARLAEAGEFTFRAYINGKLDLAQAEAVQDLINADSAQALRLAASALHGAVSKQVLRWIALLEALLAEIEVFHDYAADDLDSSVVAGSVAQPHHLLFALGELADGIDSALAAALRTAPLREGISVALCGAPNAGKSTLFNALLGHVRALTAPEPGTTRDYVTATIEVRGLRITLVDTAGMRQAQDPLEAAGVELAQHWGRSADFVLWLEAADDPAPAPAESLPGQLWLVRSRCDTLPGWPAREPGVYAVSGLTGQGVAELREALVEHVVRAAGTSAQAAFTARQVEHAARAAGFIQQARAGLVNGLPLDAVSADMHAARTALQEICEQQDRNSIIAQVFSRFCVGK